METTLINTECYHSLWGVFVFGGAIGAVSNRWTGLLEWTTGMDFDLFFLLPRANYMH